MTTKREQIERALGWLEQIFRDSENQPPQWDSIAHALAENKGVIVVECEVEHPTWYGKDTWIKTKKAPYYGQINILGEYHGKPGKALGIVVSLEEE